MNLSIGLGIGCLRGSAFDPVAALFGSGEQGYIIPWLPGTVWKDTARTIPCTAQDDLIAWADDISGNGNHFVQPIESRRFKWQTDGARYWALPDAFDDFMTSVSTVALSASDKLTIWAGLEKSSDAAVAIFLEMSASTLAANPGAAAWVIPANSGDTRAAFNVRGSSAIASRIGNWGAAPRRAVMSCAYDIAGATQADEIFPRINGSVPVQQTAGSPSGTGNFGNYTHYLGCRGGTSLFFPGRIYPVVVRGRTTSPELIAATEQWINAKTGAY